MSSSFRKTCRLGKVLGFRKGRARFIRHGLPQSRPRLLFLVSLLFFLLITRSVWPLESLTPEERLLRMEHELKELIGRNEHLQKELSDLEDRLELQSEADSQIFQEIQREKSQKGGKTEEGNPELEVGYKDDFYAVSEGKEFNFVLGGCFRPRLTLIDLDDDSDSEFSIKKARLDANATMLDYYYSRVEIELAGSVKLKDGYLELRHFPEARLRFGQFIVPFTLEAHLLSSYADFADSSLAGTNMLLGTRDVGVMVNGILNSGFLKYRVALLNGAGENTGDNNNGKDIAARLVLMPFRSSENESLSGLSCGISGTFGNQNTDFSETTFKTSGGTEFVDFADGSIHKGNRSRLGAEFAWLIGPALLKAEWMGMWLDDFHGPTSRADLFLGGAYISASYLLTGEKKDPFGTVPKHSFEPNRGAWGAWEAATRYSFFAADDNCFRHGMATGASRADAFTVGLNWYLNQFVRVIFDYEHTMFTDTDDTAGETISDEDKFVVQWQLDF